MKLFTVIDTQTGTDPDLEAIALREEWAHDLIYCDMDGFSVGSDGELYLMDECGSYKSCPLGRFKVIWLTNIKQGDDLREQLGKVPEAMGEVEPYHERDQT